MSAGRPDFTPLQDNAPGQPPRSLWEKVLNAIPIIMTVLATLLAGLSSSEMTQAQYFRALAAQYQSKVGDQWNFFQAKRQRGVLALGQLDALRAELAGGGEMNYVECAAQLARDLRRAARQAAQLAVAAEKAADPMSPRSLFREARDLLMTLAAHSDEANLDYMQAFLKVAPGEYRTELGGARFRDPRPTLREELTAFASGLPEVLDAIERRKPEAEIAAQLAGTRPDSLSQAAELLQTRADEFDAATRPTVKRLEQANALVVERAERLQPVFAAARTLERAWDDLPSDASKAAGLRAAVEEALRVVRRAGGGLTNLLRVVQLARAEYNERRYEAEARYNQVIAGLYEAQVRKSGVAADKHRRRSYLFFYAMLAAQGGVTLATFALAVRQMSALWGLASFVGLAAMAGGIYVYLFI